MQGHRFMLAAMVGTMLTTLWWVQVPTLAMAHAVPEAFTPRPHAILDIVPPALHLRFKEPVVPSFSHITVRLQTGKTIYAGEGQAVDPTNKELAVRLPAMGQGVYIVSWSVLSAVDGHATRGSFSFSVGVKAIPDSVTVSTQVSVLSVVARWLSLTGTALMFGLFAFRLFIWNPIFMGAELPSEAEALDRNQARLSLRLGWIGLLVFVAGLLCMFIDQARAYGLLQGSNVLTWLETRFGDRWLLRLVLAVSGGVTLTMLQRGLRHGRHALRGWEWWAGLVVSAAFALTMSLISHSAAISQYPGRALVVDLAHLLTAGMWGGGLLCLALSLRQARHLPMQTRAWFFWHLVLHFSAGAAAAVGVLLLSGGYLAWQHVGGWMQLIGTAYGLTLLVKIGLALPALGLAAINMLVMKPRLRASLQPTDASAAAVLRRFGRLVWCEATLIFLVLLAAAVLTDIQQGQDAPLWGETSGKAALAATVDDLTVALTITPARVGQNRFDVSLTDVNGAPVTEVRDVALRYVFRGPSIAPATDRGTSQGNGHYILEGNYISMTGTWEVEVAIRRAQRFDTFALYRLEAEPDGRIRSYTPRKPVVQQLAHWLTWLGHGVTGAFLMLFAGTWGYLATRAARRPWQVVPYLFLATLAFGFGVYNLITFLARDVTPMKFYTNPLQADATSIAMGQRVYRTHCLSCHGPTGLGDGHLARKLRQPPAAFTVRLTPTHSDGDLFYWIQHGMAGTAMPAFAEYVSQEDTWHVINYMHQFRGQR